MLADVSRQALELARRLEETRHLPVRLDARAQVRRLRDRILELDPQRFGHQLRDPVDVAEGHAEHAPDVADHRLRLERPEGRDLRHAHLIGRRTGGPVVLLGDVADHLVSPAHAEVDVDVRHRDPLGVEEALEDDVVLDRVDAGDAEPVGHEAARGGAAAGAHRNSAAPRVVDEVRDDQEVPGEPHRLDHAELALQALFVTPVLRRNRFVGLEPEPAPQPFPRLRLEHLLAIEPRRHLEFRQVIAAHLDLDVAALGDLERRVHGRRMIVEELAHLVAIAHVEAAAVEAEALRVVVVRRGADAQEQIVVAVIALFQVMRIVGRHQRKPEICGHLQQLGVDLILRGNPVSLHLQVEAPGKDPAELLDDAPGAIGIPGEDRAAHHRRQAARGGDQSLAVVAEQVEIDPRLVVEPFQIALRNQVHQVAIAGLVHREQQQVIDGVEAGVVAFASLFVEARARGDVGLAAEDRLHAGAARLLVEVHRSEQVAVIRHRDSGHVERLYPLHQRAELDGAVEERVLGVEMEVREGSRHPTPTPTRWWPGVSTRCRRRRD